MMRITTDPDTTVRVSRIYRAPLFRMFDAFAEPSQFSQWWGPFPGGSGDTHELIFEANPAGEFHWVLSDSKGRLHTINGEVHEVVTRERIMFTWHESEGMPHFDHDDHHERDGRLRHLENVDIKESVVNIDFREGQGVEVRVLHTDLPDRETRDALEAGWEAALERLEQYIQSRGPDQSVAAAETCACAC